LRSTQGARLLGERALFSGDWLSRSRASFRSTSNFTDKVRKLSAGKERILSSSSSIAPNGNRIISAT